MSDSDIIAILVEVMQDAFRRPALKFDPNEQLRDLFGIDSVQFVTLILALEERFGVLFPEDRVDALTTEQSLFDLVKSMVAK